MVFRPVRAGLVNRTPLPPDPNRKPGRPKMLEMDEGLIDAIAEHVKAGLFYVEAAALEGISAKSVNTWMRKGTQDLEGGDFDTVEARFTAAVKRAAAEAESESVKAIRRAGNASIPGAWMAHAWYLERKYPDRYGKQDRQQVELKGKLGIGIVAANLDGKPEDLQEDGSDKLAAIAGILASGEDQGTSTD